MYCSIIEQVAAAISQPKKPFNTNTKLQNPPITGRDARPLPMNCHSRP